MISAIVLTKNEEKNIEDCLKTLKWCDEILIIDDNSIDKTREIAQRLRARILTYSLNNDFAAQRNFGLEKAKGEWVLFIDADERISRKLQDEIRYLITTRDRDKQLNGYFVKRRDFMWGRELRHGEMGNIKLLRLAKKETGVWIGKVHERWEIKGKVGELKNILWHYPHPTIAEFLADVNFYSTLRAQELFNQGVSAYWLSIIIYPLGKFIQNYFFKLGFLDGIPGFLVAVMMSFHSFLNRGKLWLLWQKK